ncbi:MAG: AAA family ATPase [Planctomycetota bacterium]
MAEQQADVQARVRQFQEDYGKIAEEVHRFIVGHADVVDEAIICLMTGGHALLEGVPGLGKTMLVRTLSEVLDLSFGRIQFTPDLMPADITGTNVVITTDRGGKAFEFQPGPIFANLILADEINRATPKTQSAILEAMQEQRVSVSRETHELPRPFFVMATQNPLEMEGTYPLPEAQLDRFQFKINVLSPEVDDLIAILDRTTGATVPSPGKVVTGKRVAEMQRLVRRVPVAAPVKEYIARLTLASHTDSPDAPSVTKRFVRYGASPRAAQSMILAAKVLALRDGRPNVAFADVRKIAYPSLRHRLILSFEGQAEGIDHDEIIRQIIEATPEAVTV